MTSQPPMPIEIVRSSLALEFPSIILEKGITVPQSNWIRLESRIRSIEGINILFTVLTGLFGSIMISAPITAFTLGKENWLYLPLMVAGAAGLICTVLCVKFADKLNSANSAKKEDILDEMRVLKTRYIPDQNEE